MSTVHNTSGVVSRF